MALGCLIIQLCIILTFCVLKIRFVQTKTTATYSISRNVPTTLLTRQTFCFKADAVCLSACVNLCTYNNDCISALSDEETKQCYLFTSTLDISYSEQYTPVTYIENLECSWLHPKEDDCCYPNGNPSCVKTSYRDCQDAFNQGERNSGGIYFLRPQPTWRLIRAVCMFDSQSGWTVIQRRLDGSVDFYRGWDDYVNGFGDLNGEYWIGLESIHYLTRENQNLSIYLETHDGESRTANYSTFYINGADTEYINHVSGYSGNAGNSWADQGMNHNNKSFSTYDNDNDPSNENCAERFQGAWWYDRCHKSNLNGRWYEGGVTSSFATGTSWYTWKGHYYSYKTIYMRLGRDNVLK